MNPPKISRMSRVLVVSKAMARTTEKIARAFVKNSLQRNPDSGLHQMNFSYSAPCSARALIESGRRNDIDYLHFYS